MQLPQDPVILLSFVNTQLRDNYPSLEEFCKTNDVNEETLKAKLSAVGYTYDAARNCFR